ncbi:DNA alkylation repair protein [Arcanobacterium haemolyticum]|nr:DNA alkylation repair protein [Arcanobacterium haemolyticum]
MDGPGLIVQLSLVGDAGRAESMSAYMRGRFEFLGVASPERRRVTQPFFRDARRDDAVDWDFVVQCWAMSAREYQYVAADYLYAVRRKLNAEDFSRIRSLAALKPWWDSVDSLQKTVTYLVVNTREGGEVMRRWSVDENFWVRRLAITHQLLRKEATDTELLSEILRANLGSSEFFINKAMGWALRDYSKTNPEWVRGFIERHQDSLASLTIREGSKYL